MRKYYLLLAFIVLNFIVKAQQLPVYSQYFNNPYIYNPAFAGTKNAAYIFLNHRQQWRGIEGAPVTSSFSFHTPLARRAAVGLNISTDKRGLLQTSSALASFGYTVPLGIDHFLRFGISAGMGNNSLDLSQLENVTDPAVLRLLNNNIYLDGQFGINYQIKNFNFGFALPKLYESAVFTDTYFSEPEIGKFKRYLFTGSYKIELGASSLEPFGMYRMTEGLPDLIEGGLTLLLKDVVWIGGSYRKDFGPTGLVGFNVKDNFSFGYAYELASAQVSSFIGGSHELQLGLRLGKVKDPNRKRKPKAKAESTTKVVPEEEPETFETIKEEKEPIVEQEIAKVESPKEEPVKLKTPKPEPEPKVIKSPEPEPKKPLVQAVVTKGKHPLELEKGHYVISGVFSSERNAQRYRDALKNRGFSSSYGYNSEKKYYYVYLKTSDNKEEIIEETVKYQQNQEFKDAWLLSVEDGGEIAKPAQSNIKPKSSVTPQSSEEVRTEKVVPRSSNEIRPENPDYTPAFNEEPVNFIVDGDEILKAKKGSNANELAEGYYIIAAAYKEKDKAEQYSASLMKEGISTKVGYNTGKNVFFIYFAKSEDANKAKEERLKRIKNKKFQDAWILQVE